MASSFQQTADLLNRIRAEIDQLAKLKQLPVGTTQTQNLYKENVVESLLCLRRNNRLDKDNLEASYAKIRDMNCKLIGLQQEYDCLEYESACLQSEIDQVRKDSSSNPVIEKIYKEEHANRMQLLDEEEQKRKDLTDVLRQVESETENVGIVCKQGASRLKQVKPHVAHMLDNVAPVIKQLEF